ncbi:MAG TPA: hypothetical protein VFZ24_06595 [Longimicrobiales bacterium]
MPTAKLIVRELRSTAAEQQLEHVLTGLAGVYGAVANCGDGCVEVDFEDDEVTIDEIVAAANAAGFQATLAS